MVWPQGHFIFVHGKYGQTSVYEKCTVYILAVLQTDVLMPFSRPMSREVVYGSTSHALIEAGVSGMNE
jgi:hypothetical protein